MPSVLLTDRTIISVTGAEAEHFLHNILTTDIESLAEGEARPGALLTPQGKILFDFLISRDGSGGFRLDCRAEIAEDFLRRLILYKLRAKVEIAKQEQMVVAASWDSDSSASASASSAFGNDSIVLRDARFKSVPALRIYGTDIPASDEPSAWHAFRIAQGIAESGSDYALSDAFPHDVLLDETDGVGFRKGCYVGQEVVSRMQHRGTARRRVLLVSADLPLPRSGTDIVANGRNIGALGSVADKSGLAIVRIDRVKDALDKATEISAGGVPLTLSIPAWAKFTFPQDAGTEEA